MLIVRQKSDDGREAAPPVRGADISVGRSADNQLRIDQPTVSSQHLKILSGLVVADCGSLNGTFINGERLKGARLVPSGTVIELGGTSIRLEVEDDPNAGPQLSLAEDVYDGGTLPAMGTPPRQDGRTTANIAVPPTPNAELDAARSEAESARAEADAARAEVEAARTELETARAQVLALHGELDAVRDQARADIDRGGEAEHALGAAEERSRALETTLAEVRGRLETVEREAEELRLAAQRPAEPAAPEAGGALFAHLNQQIQRQQQKIAELEAFRSAAGGAGAVPIDAGDPQRERELEAEVARLEGLLRDSERAVPTAGADLVAEGPASTDADAAAEDERARLESENERLREQLEQARGTVEKVPAEPVTVAPSDEIPRPDLTQPLTEARQRIVELERELSAARTAGLQRPPAAPAQPAFAADAADVWQAFATQDIENREPLLQGPPTEFMTLEMLRLVRKVERVGTRIAQDAIGNIPRDTLLPGESDNLRTYVGRVLADASDVDSRRALVGHAQQLTRWLLVSVAAQRKAAEQLVCSLRDQLSEPALLAASPLSAKARLVGKETELWRRAVRVLSEMTPAYLEDRLDELARDEAGKLLQEA